MIKSYSKKTVGTSVELLQLVNAMKAGDISARNEILLQSMGLIKKCVSEIKHSEYDFEELVQEAVVIMLDVLPRYDPEKASLSTFIWNNVKMELINSTQKMPVRLYKLSRRIAKAEDYLLESHKPVTMEALSDLLGLSVSKLKMYMDEMGLYNTFSLDQSFFDDDDSETGVSMVSDEASVTPEQDCINTITLEELSKAVDTLSDKQRMVLNLHYNLNQSKEGPLSFRQIGNLMEVNHQNIAYIENTALKQLRNQFEIGKCA